MLTAGFLRQLCTSHIDKAVRGDAAQTSPGWIRSLCHIWGPLFMQNITTFFMLESFESGGNLKALNSVVVKELELTYHNGYIVNNKVSLFPQ